MATKKIAKKKAAVKKSYFPPGAIARTYYFSPEAMAAFDKKLGELTEEAISLGKRIPKKHQLASKLFCKAAAIDVKKWFDKD